MRGKTCVLNLTIFKQDINEIQISGGQILKFGTFYQLFLLMPGESNHSTDEASKVN